VHTVELHNSKILIRPNQAESMKEKIVIIGDERPEKKLTQKAPQATKNTRGARQEEEDRQQVDRSDRPQRRSDWCAQ